MVDKKTLIVIIVILAIVVLVLLVMRVTGYGVFSGRGKCVSNGYECGDCIDNDGDSLIDYKVNKRGVVTGDSDCSSLTDNTEAPCVPICNKNSDCGTNGYVGEPYCGVDGNVYRDYKSYTCYNPGLCIASCGSQTDSYLWDSCVSGCSNGTCVSCTPESNAAFCARLGKNCGNVTASDNCGNSRTVNCGTCQSGYTCTNGNCVLSNSCSDTDGGLNTGVQGSVSGYFNGNSYSYIDACISNSTLREYYCSGTSARNSTMSCVSNLTTACSDGKCI